MTRLTGTLPIVSTSDLPARFGSVPLPRFGQDALSQILFGITIHLNELFASTGSV